MSKRATDTPGSAPMANFQSRLDHLFRTVRAPDGGEYTYQQVASGIEQRVGYRTSPSYLQAMRTGAHVNPSMRHLHALCAFFGVPIEYFFDEDLARRLDKELELAASLRDSTVRELARRAVGLSSDAVETLTRMVEHARHLEGLETRTDGGTASNGSNGVFRPKRRGRRPRISGGEAPTSETLPTNGAP